MKRHGQRAFSQCKYRRSRRWKVTVRMVPVCGRADQCHRGYKYIRIVERRQRLEDPWEIVTASVQEGVR